MAVKIKLKRLGKIREPYYRIVVADARTKRDGRAIEEIGKYHPKTDPSFIEVNSERAQHWLSVGAQPTDPVRKILEITGDWQKFKGLPGTEGTLRMAAPKVDRKEIFAAAVKETLGDTVAPPKARAKAKTAEAKAGEAKAGEAKAGPAKAGEAKAGPADKPARPAKAAKTETVADAAAAAPADTVAADAAPAADSVAADAAPAADAVTAEAAGSAATDGAATDSAATDSAADSAAAGSGD